MHRGEGPRVWLAARSGSAPLVGQAEAHNQPRVTSGSKKAELLRFRLKQGQGPREETQDSYRFTDIITRECPSNAGSWRLFLMGGILIGAAITKNRSDRARASQMPRPQPNVARTLAHRFGSRGG